jgi:hypothetical protein
VRILQIVMLNPDGWGWNTPPQFKLQLELLYRFHKGEADILLISTCDLPAELADPNSWPFWLRCIQLYPGNSAFRAMVLENIIQQVSDPGDISEKRNGRNLHHHLAHATSRRYDKVFVTYGVESDLRYGGLVADELRKELAKEFVVKPFIHIYPTDLQSGPGPCERIRPTSRKLHIVTALPDLAEDQQMDYLYALSDVDDGLADVTVIGYELSGEHDWLRCHSVSRFIYPGLDKINGQLLVLCDERYVAPSHISFRPQVTLADRLMFHPAISAYDEVVVTHYWHRDSGLNYALGYWPVSSDAIRMQPIPAAA